MGIYCLLVGVQPENARLSLNCIVRHGEKEDFMDENRQHQTKPTVSALGKLTRGKRAYAVLVLCATTAMSLPAQTLTTLYSFLDSFGSRPPDDPRSEERRVGKECRS